MTVLLEKVERAQIVLPYVTLLSREREVIDLCLVGPAPTRDEMIDLVKRVLGDSVAQDVARSLTGYLVSDLALVDATLKLSRKSYMSYLLQGSLYNDRAFLGRERAITRMRE